MERRNEIYYTVKVLQTKSITNRFRLSGGGMNPSFGKDIDKAILDYYRELCSKRHVVTESMLVKKWEEYDPAAVSAVTPCATCVCMYRFMKRHHIVLRAVTHQAQNETHSIEVIHDFVKYIGYKVNMLGIPWSCVANFDGMNVYFAPESRYTLADQGSRTVSRQRSLSHPIVAPQCIVLLLLESFSCQ